MLLPAAQAARVHEPRGGAMAGGATEGVIETDIPARLDRLPWDRFHTLVVVALGITWILDGLEVTLAGSLAGALKASPVLRFSNVDIGLAGSAYLVGAVLGALFFGWLTDRLGRKKLFFITLARLSRARRRRPRCRGISGASRCSVSSPAPASAANTPRSTRRSRSSMPARYRGCTDLAINGSFWVGAALGALGSIVLLDPPCSIRRSAGGSPS